MGINAEATKYITIAKVKRQEEVKKQQTESTYFAATERSLEKKSTEGSASTTPRSDLNSENALNMQEERSLHPGSPLYKHVQFIDEVKDKK